MSGDFLFGCWVVGFLTLMYFGGDIIAPLFSLIGASWMR
jgi:hypothetical protein